MSFERPECVLLGGEYDDGKCVIEGREFDIDRDDREFVGEAQDLSNPGFSQIVNPNALMSPLTDGERSGLFHLVGAYPPIGPSEFNYLFHESQNVSLGEMTDYYEENNVCAELNYISSDGEAVVSVHCPKVDGYSVSWEEVFKRKV